MIFYESKSTQASKWESHGILVDESWFRKVIWLCVGIIWNMQWIEWGWMLNGYHGRKLVFSYKICNFVDLDEWKCQLSHTPIKWT